MSDVIEPSLSGSRILLVEDEVLVAMELEAALEDAGAVVVGPAASLDAACLHAQSAEIDAAILDINLGGRDVFAAAELLDQRGIPYVFHTAQPPRKPLNGKTICIKPIEPSRLISVLKDLRSPA